MISRPRRAARLRPARFDDLGLRRAISDRLLPLLVAAMAFLAALALAGAVAAFAVLALGIRQSTVFVGTGCSVGSETSAAAIL